jgi:hypothetical protein
MEGLLYFNFKSGEEARVEPRRIAESVHGPRQFSNIAGRWPTLGPYAECGKRKRRQISTLAEDQGILALNEVVKE